MLNNLMEDKQLDFNQPLLSVRRTAPKSEPKNKGYTDKEKADNSLPKIPPLPVYKSDLKSGPVRHPGTVPFIWEQTPGRPKDESKSQTEVLKPPPVVPKLPPGRILNVKQQSSQKGSEDKRLALTPKGNVQSCPQNISPSNKGTATHEKSKGEVNETESSGSDDGDSVYVDAADTLSRTESFFLNCSTSGVSGLDGPDTIPLGNFSTDPHTRDFMMDRFLPAAKAMASGTSPYPPRKQPIVQEQPKQIKKVTNVSKRRPFYHFHSNNVLSHVQDNVWDGSDDEDDSSVSETSSSAKAACGLVPQFLLKGSLCLLNPVPGMKMQARRPACSVRRILAKSLEPFSETENKLAGGAASKRGSIGSLQIEELHEDKNDLRTKSSQTSTRSNCQIPDKSSVYRRLQGKDVSCQSLCEENGFLGVPERVKDCGFNDFEAHKTQGKKFGELLASEESKRESGAGSPVIEKTLYIDSIHKVKSPASSSLDSRGHPDHGSKDFEIPGEMEDTASVNSSLQDLKHLNVVVKKAVLSDEVVESVDAYSVRSPKKTGNDMKVDATNCSGEFQDSSCTKAVHKDVDTGSQQHMKISDKGTSHRLIQDITKSSRVPEDKEVEPKKHFHVDLSNQEISRGSSWQSPIGPPLPKSPSESWLKRALPTVSSRNPSSRSSPGAPTCIRTQAPAPQASFVDPKWNTIVRTSKEQNGRLRFPEELLAPIPEA